VVTADGGAQHQLLQVQRLEVLVAALAAFHLELAQELLELTGKAIRVAMQPRLVLAAPPVGVVALALLEETQFLLA
jgi:hypothetical protein